MNSEPAYTLNEQQGFVRVTFAGGTLVTPQMVMEVIDLENLRYGTKRLNALWDFRGCLPPEHFGFNDMDDIVQHVQIQSGFKWSPRVALLIEADVQYGLSRMYQMLVEGFPTEVDIFYDESEALAWVR